MFLRVNEREGEGIRSIGRGQFGEVQHALHHPGDGDFLRAAVADDGLLHFAGGDLKNIQPGFGDDGHGGTPGFTHDDGGLDILREEKAFDGAHFRLVPLEDVAQGPANMGEAAGTFPIARTGNGSLDEDHGMGSSGLDDAVAGAAQ